MAMSVCPARRRRQRRRRRRSRTRSKRPRHVSTNRTRTPILHHVFFFGSDGPRFAAHSSPRTKRLNDTQDRPPHRSRRVRGGIVHGTLEPRPVRSRTKTSGITQIEIRRYSTPKTTFPNARDTVLFINVSDNAVAYPWALIPIDVRYADDSFRC